MPILKTTRWGLALPVALLALGAAPALAGDTDQDRPLIVHQADTDTQAVTVPVGDLNLASTADRNLLDIRLRNATRRVCDVTRGSALDSLPDARECMAQAKSRALAELDARGRENRQMALTPGG